MRRIVALPVCLVLIALLVTPTGCLLGGGSEVEVSSPSRGEIEASFTEPSQTRLANTYRITMPISGRIERVTLRPGDKVTKGQELVAFDREAIDQQVKQYQSEVNRLQAQMKVDDDNRLENLALKETQALVKANAQMLKAQEESIKSAAEQVANAKREYDRLSKLGEGSVSRTQLDQAKLSATTAKISQHKEEFYLAALKALTVAVNMGPDFVTQYVAKKSLKKSVLMMQLAGAQANLAKALHEQKLARVVSPIDGVVLERFDQGDRQLQAGQSLLLLGDLNQMEVVSEVLTQDALLLKEGGMVSLEPAAGLKALDGKILRIEPAGFTKTSSLGVEQQRVRVIISLPGGRGSLGVGYRVQARFQTGVKKDALLVPRFSVLQAPDRTHYVFKVTGGKLARQTVKLGLRSDLTLEVVEGLTTSDKILARPDATMKDGQRVSVK